MKKMCKWFGKGSCSVSFGDKGYSKYKKVYRDCPKNVNDKCQITESRYKKIKARFVIDKNGEIWASPWNMPDDGYPCTILIDKKYLK